MADSMIETSVLRSTRYPLYQVRQLSSDSDIHSDPFIDLAPNGKLSWSWFPTHPMELQRAMEIRDMAKKQVGAGIYLWRAA